MSKGHKKNPSAGATAHPATPATGDSHSDPKSILRVYLDSITTGVLAAVRSTTTTTVVSLYNSTVATIKANPRRTYNYLLLALNVVAAALIYRDRHNETLRVQLGSHSWSFGNNNRDLYTPLTATSAALFAFGNYFLEK